MYCYMSGILSVVYMRVVVLFERYRECYIRGIGCVGLYETQEV